MKLIDPKEALRMMRNSRQDNPLPREMKGIWETAHDCCMSCVEAVPSATPAIIEFLKSILEEDPVSEFHRGYFAAITDLINLLQRNEET